MRSTAIDRILDTARWAPSGDNTQPWRFEIVDENHVVVHGFDTREHCVYDLDGRPSQISVGAMLETMAIAATHEGLRAFVERRMDPSETCLTFDVQFKSAVSLPPDPLFDQVRKRSVQRRPMRMRTLDDAEKQALQTSVGTGFRVLWIEPLASRLKTARLMFDSAKLRLTMPEAYQVHREVIEWNAQFSEDRIPDQALGIDPLMMRLMKHVMRSWRRVNFFNTYLAGTLLPRIQMDLIPAVACAAHFVLVADRPASNVDDHVRAGRALQRFWLTASRLGLEMQPELTPLIFARYARDRIKFSAIPGMSRRAFEVSRRLDRLIGEPEGRAAVFMGRLGAGPRARARSTRKRLEDLAFDGIAAGERSAHRSSDDSEQLTATIGVPTPDRSFV